MDIQDFLQNKGMQEIPNPAYKPKSKKNKVSPTIKVPQLIPTLSEGVNMAIVDFNNQYSISKEENDKYANYGLNYSPYENMDLALAEKQSAWKKWGNALAQTVVSELGLGTLKAGSDLVDFVGQALHISSPDYTNPVSEYLEKKQEEFRNFAPIYNDPSKNIFNGGLVDAGWWASNMPSIISSLTLLLPAGGVTLAAKAAGIGKVVTGAKRFLKPVQKAVAKSKEVERLTKTGASAEKIAKAGKLTFWEKALTNDKYRAATNIAIENTTTAALSRTMENYQESRQTYNDVYLQASEVLRNMSDEDYQNVLDRSKDILEKAGIDGTNRDEVAKAIAKRSADETFKLDYLNTLWDVLQLYALRGLYTGKGATGDISASVRRANKDAIQFAGKTQQEIAAIKAKRSFKEKAKDWIEDRAYTSKVVIGAELSEGAEEALNYVAQQEGMHLGNVLTGQIDDTHDTNFWENVLTGFDGRLSDYIAAPALWDSAFWGVLGGVVFQGLGSKAKQISQKWGRNSELTEEERKKLPWYQFDELPINKARITEAQNRAVRAQEYVAKRNQILNNIDPANSTKDNEVKFASPVEQQVALNRLEEEYTDQLALDAMHVGTTDMLKAYFSNDNVRKAMIEAGAFNEKDEQGNPIQQSEAELDAKSKEFVQRTLQRIEKIEDMYNQELVKISDLVGVLNAENKREDRIPAEYINIIADRNVRRRLAGEVIDRSLNAISTEADNLRAQLINDRKLDGAIDYENNFKLKAYSDRLGILRANRRELLKDKENSLSNQIAIDNINKEINYIETELAKSYSLAAMTFAIHRSLQFIEENTDGTWTLGDTPESMAYKAELIDNRIVNGVETKFNFDELFPESYLGPQIVLNNAEVGEFNTIKSDFDRSYNDLYNVSPKLRNLYDAKYKYKLQKEKLLGEIVGNREELTDYANVLANTMDEARTKAINVAYNKISDIYNNNREGVLDALTLLRQNKPFDELTNLTDAEKKTLKDAIDTLAVTKLKNKNLIEEIYKTLQTEEALKLAAEANNPHNNNSNNPANNNQNNNQTPASNSGQTQSQSGQTPSNPSQSPQNSQQTNSSPQSQNSSQQAPSPQNQVPTNQIDPQRIDNRQPSFRQSYGAINNLDTPSNPNKQIAFYDNGDGTFTISTLPYTELYKDSTLYENADEVDLLNGTPYISVYPIVQSNQNGTYDVIQKGTVGILVGKNTQTQQPSPAPTPQPSPQPTPISPANPSTGVVEEQTGNNEEEALAGVKLDALSKLNATASRELIPILKAGLSSSNVNYDDLIDKINARAEQLVNDAIINGIDRTQAQNIINKVANKLISRIERIKNNSAPTMQSSVDEVFFTQYDMYSSRGKDNETSAVAAYRKAVYDMFNQYIAEQGLQKYNGKTYIVLEDLLRYINNNTNDSQIAASIFESLKNLINSNDFKDSYVIVDKEELNSNKFWQNVNKSVEARAQERVQEVSVVSVDLTRVIKEASHNADKLNDIYNALNNLNPGDKLNIEVDRTKKIIYIKDDNGTSVASIPIPNIDEKTGAYSFINDGWLYDISQDNSRNIKSNLLDFLVEAFKGDTQASKELLSILYESAFTKPSKERAKELLDNLINNEIIKQARNLSFIAGKNEEIANGLVKLIRFLRDIKGSELFSDDTRYEIKDSLKDWFKKLNHSYDLAVTLANNSSDNFSITVDAISTGEIIRVQEQVTDPSKLTPSSQAFADGLNSNIKFAITNPQNTTEFLVAGGMSTNPVTPTLGRTFVILPDKRGTNQFVQAFPVNVTDSVLGNEAKEIISAIKSYALKLFRDYNENSTIENRNAIEDFFNKLLTNNGSNSTLFRNAFIAPFKNKNGFYIQVPYTKHAILIYNNVQADENGVKVGIGKEKKTDPDRSIGINSKEFEDVLNNLIDQLDFQFSYSYFQSDNNTNINLNGIATRENGKFVITIGDNKWEFNSFNDFVLKQNLVRVNTKVENGSNFTKGFTRNPKVQPTFNISVTRNTSTPVEESTSTESIPAPTNIPVTQQVLNILNSDTTNAGNEIIKALIGTSSRYTEKTLKAFEDLGILPKIIKFDANFNIEHPTDNAVSIFKTGTVIVGQKWLDQFNNPASRDRAIRILIHEQIHMLLNKDKTSRKHLLNNIKEIYNEYKDALNNPEHIKTLEKVGFNVDDLKIYLFEDNPTTPTELDKLEEFLVESITNRSLAIALNNINIGYTRKGKVRNLFQKILKFLSDLFSWKVNQGSLYEKELDVIRTSISENNIEEDNNKDKNKNKNNEDKTKTKEIQNPSLFTEEETKEEGVIQTEEVPQIQEEPKVEPRVEIESTTQPETEKQFGEGRKRSRDRGKSRFSSVDEVNNNYTPEMNDIKSKTIADGTFMKAPNGKDTNLNERQWLQVRTQNFINWFGDWINSPKIASKIVDKNGEPLVVYHVSDTQFNIFRNSLNRYGFDSGIFFTNSLDYAKYVTNNGKKRNIVYSVFLNVHRPLFTKEELEYETTSKIIESERPVDKDIYFEKFPNNSDEDYEVYAEETGFDAHDGIIGEDTQKGNFKGKSTEYVVINPNQIKSATSNIGDFSTSNDDIRYSSVDEVSFSAPSISAFIDRLPIQQQAKFASLVNRGEVSISCR